MKRWLSPLKTMIVGVCCAALVAGCGGQAPAATPVAATPGLGGQPTVESGTTIASTSAVPTSTAAASTMGESLPFGSLILSQRDQFVAQLPGGRTIALAADRIPPIGSPNGRYGIRYVTNGDKVDIVIADYSATPAAVKTIPNGTALISPAAIWRDDSGGVAFADIPMPDQVAQSKRMVYFFDLASGQTRELANETQTPNTYPVPVAFSPDGKYLVYLLGTGGLESDGTLQIVMLDTNTGQKTPLPLGQSAFNQWLRDSSGFIAQDSQARIVVYRLNALQTPVVLTPDGQTDLYPTLSPDGKFIAVASIAARPAADQPPTNNVFLMNLDGTSRRQITEFTDAQQSLTGLIWGSDGIYYSLFTGDSLDTVFRMDLDGKNPAQVAQGALLGIAGIR